ncbi:hypothetical protein ACQKKX_13410 [Neorhizobium sp. NPDC001467]|uniref:hypothetical protein n=1 Tax=Neorhizobium sp. NPDC001467 TaxID=3390595 RepID=UPI003D02A206
MRLVRIVLTILGLLMLLAGLLWAAQGTGIFPYPASSFMIDQSPWILRGAVVAVIGAAILWIARRHLR